MVMQIIKFVEVKMKKRIPGIVTLFAAVIFLVGDFGTEAYASGFSAVGGNVMYLMDDGTFLRDTWFNDGPYVWHFDENGAVQTGVVEIDGQLWYLTIDGIAIPATTAAMAIPIQTVVPQVDMSSDFAQVVASAIAGCTTADMTQDQKLYACYMYVINHTSYVRTYETPSGDWTKAYALDVYEKGMGNCYRYAAAFAYMAKALGYDARVCTGQVSASRGGVTPHGWVEIPINGITYYFDPDMQDAKKKDYYFKTYSSYPTKPLIKQAEWPVAF